MTSDIASEVLARICERFCATEHCHLCIFVREAFSARDHLRKENERLEREVAARVSATRAKDAAALANANARIDALERELNGERLATQALRRRIRLAEGVSDG